MTLKPNGQAAACKAVLRGFDSRRRLFSGLVQLMASAQRRTGHRKRFEFVRTGHGFQTGVINVVSSMGRAPD